MKSSAYACARLVWWLVPCIGLVLVLVTGYQAVSTRRFENANGVAGELLAGKSVGQSFVARYDNLSGVELHLGTYNTGTAPSRATLVLQLRAGSSGQGLAGPVLATAVLSAGQLLAENAWYLYSFPPISDSQERAFYIEVSSPDGARGHALTLYWWQPNSASLRGDPYADGTAFLDGKPQPGDLAFALHYEPSPISAATQVMRAISVNLPAPMMLLLFGGVLAAVSTLLYVLIALGESERRRRWLRRWSLPFVLGVALLSGLLYLLLVPPWQGPDEPAHFAYAAMLDHYNFDHAKIWDIYLHRRTPDKQLADAINASMAQHNFTRLISGQPAPGSPPNAGATLFGALGKQPSYYWLGAMALRFARMLGIADDPYTDPDTALMVLRGVSVVLGMVVVALAWLAARIISRDDGSWLILLLPLAVAVLPMHTFDTAIFENDVLAEVAVSAVFVVLAALLRWPTGWRAVALAALAVLLSVGGIFTKSTADAAFPLLAGGLLVWIGLLVTRALDRRANISAGAIDGQGWVKNRRRAIVVPGVILGLLVALAVGTLLVAYQPQNQTAGWVTSWSPLRPMSRTATPTAHDGHFVLDLGPKGPQAVTAVQMLLPPVYHPAMKVNVTGWVRIAPGASKPLVVSPTAVIRIEQGASLMARTDVFLDSSGVWRPINATADIEEGLQQIVLRITSAGQRAQFDDFALQVDEGPVAWRDPVFQPTLLNPSAESGFLGLRPELASRLPASVVALADVMPNPQPFDKLALWGLYANAQYTSFWGSFGWLSIPLPGSLYAVLTIISALALAGLVGRAVRSVRRWGTSEMDRPEYGVPSGTRSKNQEEGSARVGWTTFDWLGFVALFSLVATVAVSYAWQMTKLATINQTALLSGRYLFVLIIPITWLLLAGLDTISSLLSSLLRRSRTEGTDVQATLPWPTWLYINGLMLFAAYCLLALIVPYYYV